MHSNIAATDSEPRTGDVLLGRYRNVRPLARGGMGLVHLGRVEGAQGFAKPVVIKTMLPTRSGEGNERAQLFAREARIVSRLQHPGIVAVVDFGQIEDSHVMILEYVHGYNLGQWFRYVNATRGPVPLPQAIHVMVAVLDALAYAHGLTGPEGTPLGIVHRDISPGNILIDLNGHVKLTDFGIARAEDDEFKTQETSFRGTVSYSSPEMLEAGVLDGRCDEYACAVVLYQMLTGIHPFKAQEPAQTIARILTHVPERISTLRSDVPQAIDTAITKAMSRDPAHRYATVAEFADALRSGLAWSERDAARDFAAQIAVDFNGDLPKRLRLEPLAVRDRAWREAEENSESSSARPKLDANGRPEARSESAAHPPPRMATELSRGWTSSRRNLGALVVVIAMVGWAALAMYLRPSGKTAPPIIVEKQSIVEPAAPEAPPATAQSSAGPSTNEPRERPGIDTPSPSAAGSRSASSAGAKPRTAANPRSLASAFQRKQGAIQRCFEQNSEALSELQRVSVRFDVDEGGRVISTGLNPASAGTTPLGACFLTIARDTNFGPQPEPVSFSVPIAARMVKR